MKRLGCHHHLGDNQNPINELDYQGKELEGGEQ